MSAQRSVRPGTANQDRKDNLNQSEGKGVTVELVTAMLTAMPASTATVAAVVFVAVVMAAGAGAGALVLMVPLAAGEGRGDVVVAEVPWWGYRCI